MRRLALALLLAGSAAVAADEGGPRALGFDAYLSAVGQGNLDLLAARANVSVVEAQVAVARVFPDPTLTAGVASVDVSGTRTPTVSELALSETVELGGKRGARIAAARDDLSSAQAGLEDTLRTLRADASDAYIDALAKATVAERKRTAEASVQRLVAVNQERLRAGDIGEIALVQSRVEYGKARGETLAAADEVEQADLTLALKLGAARGSGGVHPSGRLDVGARSFDIERLITSARQERADVRSRRFALDAARSRVRLAHANRWIDLTFEVSWQHSFETEGGPHIAFGANAAVGGQYAYDFLGASLSVPLPFSRVYKGELQGAQFGQNVAELQLQATQLKVEVDLRQAWAKYQTAVQRLRLYDSGLLKDADRVLEAKLYEYQRGGAPLLEVLEAQRTDNDVHLDYIDALADHAHALVALEQAAGIWDLRF